MNELRAVAVSSPVLTCSHQQKQVTAMQSASDHNSTAALVAMLPSFDS